MADLHARTVQYYTAGIMYIEYRWLTNVCSLTTGDSVFIILTEYIDIRHQFVIYVIMYNNVLLSNYFLYYNIIVDCFNL